MGIIVGLGFLFLSLDCTFRSAGIKTMFTLGWILGCVFGYLYFGSL